jgi:hypothetical protein
MVSIFKTLHLAMFVLSEPGKHIGRCSEIKECLTKIFQALLVTGANAISSSPD